MGFYERVARNSGDNELLLDYLEKRAQLPGTTPAQIREAVAVALDVGQELRAEALLERAVAAAREADGGVAESSWAVRQLAERRLAADKLTVARDLVYEVASTADADEVSRLLGESIRAAGSPEMNPYGLEANRRNLEVAVDYVYRQRLIPRRYAVEELYA